MRMKLSTRSRYGTRLMLDMAQHYNKGPIQLGDIAKRQDVSVKYLEQIIIPLKRAHYIESVRGPKGGHILTKPPEEITVGEIVALLEDSSCLVECCEDTTVCDRADLCPTRGLWKEASEAMFDRLAAITLADLVEKAKAMESKKFDQVLASA
jgi:Rrf2 family iron-sulfur cluster assembly transcriptional regulator